MAGQSNTNISQNGRPPNDIPEMYWNITTWIDVGRDTPDPYGFCTGWSCLPKSSGAIEAEGETYNKIRAGGKILYELFERATTRRCSQILNRGTDLPSYVKANKMLESVYLHECGHDIIRNFSDYLQSSNLSVEDLEGYDKTEIIQAMKLLGMKCTNRDHGYKHFTHFDTSQITKEPSPQFKHIDASPAQAEYIPARLWGDWKTIVDEMKTPLSKKEQTLYGNYLTEHRRKYEEQESDTDDDGSEAGSDDAVSVADSDDAVYGSDDDSKHSSDAETVTGDLNAVHIS